jgi:hypothetical protein
MFDHDNVCSSEAFTLDADLGVGRHPSRGCQFAQRRMSGTDRVAEARWHDWVCNQGKKHQVVRALALPVQSQRPPRCFALD